MKIVQINGGVFGSTGKIMFGIARIASQQGHDVLCVSPVTTTNRWKEPDDKYIKIGSYWSRVANVLLARITGLEGCFALFSTIKLIKILKKYKPDIIHLHSIHNSYINIPMLFSYIKKYSIRVVWTLHDCWSFTGHCPHFEYEGCNKWKTGCYDCIKYHEYPKSFFDNSKRMYKLKKKWFIGIKNMTIITPSQWLANLIKQSFLKEYPVKVIHNGIDLSIFKPTESDFRKKYNCENKAVVLGVAFGWDDKKGLDVFIELANRLDEEKYQIVLVGTDEEVDKKLTGNMISVPRTQNQEELVQIYSAADVFVNPTREDTFPTVNLEALACGVPVVTFNTGGSPEMLSKESGVVIRNKEIDVIEQNIIRICKNRTFEKENCINAVKDFYQDNKFMEYLGVYRS